MRTLSFVLALSLLAACGEDPGKDKTAAQVADAVPVAPPPAAAPAPAGSFALNGAIAFTGAKVTGKHDGTFQSWRGTAVVTDGQLASITFSVDTASLKTDAAKLDEHLKGGDFFDVAKFATATFESTEVKAGAPADSKLVGATHTVTGNMTILGISKSVTVPAKLEIGTDGTFKALSEFAINRKDFNIVYPGKPDDLIKEDVALKIEVSGNTAAGTAAAGAAAPAGASPAPAAAPAPAAGH
jgi:polyisoprenoid-binding protein YceI